MENLIASNTLRIAEWALVMKEFSSFSIKNILLNWEACMECSPIRVRKVVHWSPPPFGVLKFSVIGAVRGKRGIGDVLCNSKGEVLFMFSKPMGIRNSNEVEVFTIL